MLSLFQVRSKYHWRVNRGEYRADINELKQLTDMCQGIIRNQEKLFWPLYAKMTDSASVSEAKKEFYLGLRPAVGDLRKVQLTELLILRRLDEIAKEHGLTWWLSSGTLLGAVRHRGFIPWDDDVDVAILRNDLRRLTELVRNDPEIEITTCFDAFSQCRQIRMKFRAYTPFIDLFPHDYCHACNRETGEVRKKLRNDLRWNIRCGKSPALLRLRFCGYLPEQKAAALNDLFAHYQKQMEEDTGVDNDHPETAQGIGWGIDNIGIKMPVFKKEQYFPLVELPFEGIDFPVPKEYMKLLKVHYGDIWSLPTDMWREHVRISAVERGRLADFLAERKMMPYVKKA